MDKKRTNDQKKQNQVKPEPEAQKPLAKQQNEEEDERTKSIIPPRFYRRASSLAPRSVVSYFDTHIKYAGIRDDVRVWLGQRIVLSMCFGFMLVMAYLIKENPMTAIETILITLWLFAAGFAPVATLIYFKLYFQISDRASTVEKILPDFLLLTSSDLKAGMTAFAAFVNSARPEFGALHEEVRRSTAKASGTASLEDTLEEIATYFDSKMLKRTTALFIKGIRSGGQLAKLLNSTAEEIRRIHDLRAELATATRSYTIFLGFVVVMVMPFLLAVSAHFLTVFLKLAPTDGTDVIIANLPSFSGNIQLTTDEMYLMTMVTIVLTSLFVSGLTGIIEKGRALYGVKYFPVFFISSTSMYFIARAVVGSLLSGFGSL